MRHVTGAKCQLDHLESSVQRTNQKIPGPPSAATIFHRRWAHAQFRLRFAPARGTTFIAWDIPLPDRSTTSRPIHADRRRPVCPHHSTCRLYEPQHPLSVGWLRWCTPVSPWTRRQRSLPFPQSSDCPPRRPHRHRRISLSQMSSRSHKTTTARSKSLQRRDTTYYFTHFDEPPRTSISNQLPDSTRQTIARELDKEPHNLTRRISIDRHLRNA